MKKYFFILLGIIVALGAAYVFYLQQKESDISNTKSQSNPTELTQQEIDLISRSIAAIDCTTFQTESGKGLPVFGSGTYLDLLDTAFNKVYSLLLTNGHVAENPSLRESNDTKDNCNVRFNNVDSGHYYYFWYSNETTIENDEYDFAVLAPEKNNGIDKANVLLNPGKQPMRICSDLHVGTKIYVFGYPGNANTFIPSPKPEGRVSSPEVIAWYKEIDEFSATRNLVLTDGIISGTRGLDYFTTAKIDTGSSGGLAVSKDENGICAAGVPTWVSVGELDNLGVIQPMSKLFKSGIDMNKITEDGFTSY